jgi:NCS1 family nucleobase:cation symporter-1
MSTDTGSAQEVRRLGVETTGIEIITEAERTAAPRDLFWPWFAANVSVFGISYAAFVLGFGISFWQAILVTVIGVVVSFALCGIIAIAGKRGSAPTMILSRAAFGVQGQKVPGVISWLVSIGWETFLAIMAVLATATIFDRLGWGGGTATKVIAAVVVAAMIVLASVAGYHIIMRMQSVLTWITGAITILYVLMTLTHIDWTKISAIPSGSLGATIGALVMVMTGFGLGWINIAADWSRYQQRSASGGAIVAWNTLGGALAPALLVCYGLALAGSDDKVKDGIAADPIGTLATLLPDVGARALPHRGDPLAGLGCGARHLLLRPDPALAGCEDPEASSSPRRRCHPHPGHLLRRLRRQELPQSRSSPSSSPSGCRWRVGRGS